MPELPDVEIYKNYFNRTSLNRIIKKVEVLDNSILFYASVQKLAGNLTGSRINSTARHGKYFFGKTEDGKYLMVHFGMTGRFEYRNDENIPKYSKVVLRFSGSLLSYICIRKLGKVSILEDKDKFVKDKKLGPDALSLEWESVKQLVNEKRGKIKGALMDQKFIAGIGNIYADEILFHSKINPQRKVQDLQEEELKKIFNSMGYVLNTAIKREAHPDKVPGSWLLPRRKKEAHCPKCKGKIKKITLSGRSTYYCPSCQG